MYTCAFSIRNSTSEQAPFTSGELYAAPYRNAQEHRTSQEHQFSTGKGLLELKGENTEIERERSTESWDLGDGGGDYRGGEGGGEYPYYQVRAIMSRHAAAHIHWDSEI